MPMVARCPTYVSQFKTVPSIIGEILAGTLVQLFVRRVSSYVEPESILGLDAKLLDLANPPWNPGTLNVPNPARWSVQRLKCAALEVWMPMVACCPTCVSHIPKVPSIMTEMLVNGLNVQWQVVMRASSYVEIRLILGVDA